MGRKIEWEGPQKSSDQPRGHNQEQAFAAAQGPEVEPKHEDQQHSGNYTYRQRGGQRGQALVSVGQREADAAQESHGKAQRKESQEMQEVGPANQRLPLRRSFRKADSR